MSLISSITKGREAQPPRIMIYGSEGVGKSTFAALAPNSVFVQTEDGLSEIDCSKFPLAKSFDDVVLQLQAVRDEQHDYGTVVIDSLDWLERLVWDRVCADYGVKSIEKADGGYGKGYVHALTYWRQIVSLLNDIRARKGMAVILIAHAAVERFEDPEHAAYETGTRPDSTRRRVRSCASGLMPSSSRRAACASIRRRARPPRSVRTAGSASCAPTVRPPASPRTALGCRRSFRSRGRRSSRR